MSIHSSARSEDSCHGLVQASKVLEWLTDNADITLVDPKPDSDSDSEPQLVAA